MAPATRRRFAPALGRRSLARCVALALPSILSFVATGCVREPQLGAPIAGGASVEPSRANVLREEWHEIRISGKPAGFIAIEERATERGFLTTSRTRLEMRRGETPIELHAIEEIEEDAAGRILSFSQARKMSRRTTTTRGRVNGDRIAVSVETEGEPPRTRTVSLDSRAVGPRRARQLTREALVNEGDTLELFVFNCELVRAIAQRSTLGAEEDIEIGGRRRRLRRVLTSSAELPEVTLWIDEEHRQLRSRVPLGDLVMETTLSTREAILSQPGGDPPEVYFATSLALNRAIPNDAAEVVYRVRFRDGSEIAKQAVALLSRAGQTIESEDANGLVLRVRAVGPEGPRERAEADDASIERTSDPSALLPSALIESDNANIVAAAHGVRQSLGDATPWMLARALERWVHEHVTEKTLDKAFASAAEVFEDRAGDCTEHAVLLAALLRAADLPARVVAGLVHHRRALVGHMWTEVLIDGHWIPLDATAGAGRVSADHIALADSTLGDSSSSDLLLRLLPILGGIEVEVLSIALP